MRKQPYPYMQDFAFLKKIDTQILREEFVKITLLDKDENPIQEIQGEIASGSLSKNGDSAVRRSCSLACQISSYDYDIRDIRAKYSIEKKIFLEIGIKNNTGEWEDYDIIWFPQGVFYINGLSIQNNSGAAITLNLNFIDKMAKLDGTLGGIIPITTRFDVMDTEIDGQVLKNQKVLVYNIIMEAVNHFGGESLENIVIDDVPLRAKRVLKSNGELPLWIVWQETENGKVNYQVVQEDNLSLSSGTYYGKAYPAGKDIGFVYEDFYYDQELTVNAGATVTQVLDTIKNWLGNFEYYYDEYGIFHFKAIKNYLNTNQATYIWEQSLSDVDYQYDITNSKSVYDFDSTQLSSFSCNPQYSNIKNDFIVCNTVTKDNVTKDIRYHLVIDDKPQINKEGYDNILLYAKPTRIVTTEYALAYPQIVNKLPETGSTSFIYMIKDKPTAFYYWHESTTETGEPIYKFDELEWIHYFAGDNGYTSPQYLEEAKEKNWPLTNRFIARDWRTELLVRGVIAEGTGIEKNPYYEELKAFWPTVYNLCSQNYVDANPVGDVYFVDSTLIINDKNLEYAIDKDGVHIIDVNSGNSYNYDSNNLIINVKDPASEISSGYFFDFIESDSPIWGQFSVNNIGRRAYINSNTNVNCTFAQPIPNNGFIFNDGKKTSEQLKKERAELEAAGCEQIFQVDASIYKNLATGGSDYGAYDIIRYDLLTHTTYQNSINFTTRPIYYLEPNSRIHMDEDEVGVIGDYVLKTINFQLGGNPMTCTASEAVEKI